MIGMEVSMEYIERYWRDATPEDAIREPPMVARFRQGKSDWFMSRLSGLDRQGDEVVWFSENDYGSDCQVYDAPDPGEGWRLIDVDKETPKEDDHYLCPISNVWCFCNEWLRRVSYSKDSVVRRRIEQPKPEPKPEPKYVPFTWEDREQLRGRWIVDRDDRFEEVIDNVSKTPDGILYANGYRSDYLMSAWTFLDTNEPVGKRVQ